MKAIVAVVAALLAGVGTQPSGAAVPVKKWAPGHYIETSDLSSADLQAPGVRGVLVRYQWTTLERDGRIDVAPIRLDMALAKAAGRQFGVILEDKAFGAQPNTRCVPPDLRDGQVIVATDTGRYTCVPLRWQRAVSERWAAFVKAVGRQLDATEVVMAQNTESATSYPGAVPAADYTAHLRREAQAFAAGWPTTPWAMSLNWGVAEKDRTPLVALIADLGGGITHPDSVPPSGQPNPFDPFFGQWKGRSVSAPLAENTFINGRETLLGTRACGGQVCTWTHVVRFVTGTLGAHYAGWQRHAWGRVPFEFARDLAPVLVANPTVTACPSNIRCRTP